MRIRYSKGENGKTVRKAFVYTKDEHKINPSYIDENAVYICSRLCTEGFETYIVGGAVRDLIIGKKPKDFDIASAASPAQIKKVFKNSRVIGRRFRLVHVFFGQKVFEVATFRSIKDGTAGNTFGTIEEDVLRRDFTINALFYDPSKSLVIDYVGGHKDIQHRRIRPIIPLKIIFKDDPVRMLRAIKYSVLSGFPLSFAIKSKIKKEAYLLKTVSPSRLTEEINKIIYSSNVAGVVELLISLDIYIYLQPNADALLKADTKFKENYFATLKALNKNSGENNISGAQNEVNCLYALCKDYVDTVFNKNLELSELYKNTFNLARSFVLPMNPQRVHMDKVVQQIIRSHGLGVKKPAPKRRGRRPLK